MPPIKPEAFDDPIVKGARLDENHPLNRVLILVRNISREAFAPIQGTCSIKYASLQHVDLGILSACLVHCGGIER
jgi:hypothetical protein